MSDPALLTRLELYLHALPTRSERTSIVDLVRWLGDFPWNTVTSDLGALGVELHDEVNVSALRAALRRGVAAARQSEADVVHTAAGNPAWQLSIKGHAVQQWLAGADESVDSAMRSELAALLTAVEHPGEIRAAEAFEHIDFYPHQVSTAATFLDRLAHTGIIADEPGLGKTFEAGIVIHELKRRGMIDSCLILTPSSLVVPWEESLRFKLGLSFSVPSDPHQVRDANLLVSIGRAKGDLASALLRRNWGLVVVDECHMLKNAETLNYRFVYSLSRKFLLLVSATPLHNDLTELYHLLTLCRPGWMGTPQQFRARFAQNRRRLTHKEGLHDRLRSILTRTRRNEVPAFRAVERFVQDVPVPLSPEETKLHSLMFDFLLAWCDKHYRGSVPVGYEPGSHVQAIILVLINLLRMITSSKAAVVKTLHGALRKRLKAAGSSKELRRLDEVLSEVRAWRHESKVAKLGASIKDYRKHGKVIVFTSWRGTAATVAKVIRKTGLQVIELNGDSDKEAVKREFKESNDVMVATEVGGEGHDLQFANVVVNYDLPWNPMRLDQRIGRVDRLKQEHSIFVYNYYSPGTIDEHILQILQEKLKMFQSTVGTMAALFAMSEDAAAHGGDDAENDDAVLPSISAIFRDSRNLQEAYKRLKDLGERWRQQREDYERLSQESDHEEFHYRPDSLNRDEHAEFHTRLASALGGSALKENELRWDLRPDFPQVIKEAQASATGVPRFLCLHNRSTIGQAEAVRRIASCIANLPEIELHRREMRFLRLMVRLSVRCINYRDCLYVIWEALDGETGSCRPAGEDFMGASYEPTRSPANIEVANIRRGLERALSRLEIDSRQELLDVVRPVIEQGAKESGWADALYAELGRHGRRGFGLSEADEYTRDDRVREAELVKRNLAELHKTEVGAEVVTCSIVFCQSWSGELEGLRIDQPTPAYRPLTGGCKECRMTRCKLTFVEGALYCESCLRLLRLRERR